MMPGRAEEARTEEMKLAEAAAREIADRLTPGMVEREPEAVVYWIAKRILDRVALIVGQASAEMEVAALAHSDSVEKEAIARAAAKLAHISSRWWAAYDRY